MATGGSSTSPFSCVMDFPAGELAALDEEEEEGDGEGSSDCV